MGDALFEQDEPMEDVIPRQPTRDVGAQPTETKTPIAGFDLCPNDTKEDDELDNKIEKTFKSRGTNNRRRNAMEKVPDL